MFSIVINSRGDYDMELYNLTRNINPMVAYQKGLSTWARWVDQNLNPRRTEVIFRSMSPRHNRYYLFLFALNFAFVLFFHLRKRKCVGTQPKQGTTFESHILSIIFCYGVCKTFP